MDSLRKYLQSTTWLRVLFRGLAVPLVVEEVFWKSEAIPKPSRALSEQRAGVLIYLHQVHTPKDDFAGASTTTSVRRLLLFWEAPAVYLLILSFSEQGW